MCGLFGCSRFTPELWRMAPILAFEVKKRGTDSYGLTNGYEVIRNAGSQVTPWVDPPDSWADGPISWHNRAASQQENAHDPECAHPFTYQAPDGTKIIGSHNGIIRNHQELNTQFGRNCQVDSMHIWMHRAEGKPWSDLDGWGNLVWFEIDPQGNRSLHFCRINADSLHAATLENGVLVWCSTISAIRVAAEMFGVPIKTTWKIDEGKHYTLALNSEDPSRDILVVQPEEYTFKHTPPQTWQGSSWIYTQNPDGSWSSKMVNNHPAPPNPVIRYAPNPEPPSLWDGECPICTKLHPKLGEFICEGCFYSEYIRWQEEKRDLAQGPIDIPNVKQEQQMRHPQVHVKLKFSGNPNKVQLFNSILGSCDAKDWPYNWEGQVQDFRLICPKCQGVVYCQPWIDPKGLLALERQVDRARVLPGGLKVKIKRWCTDDTCRCTWQAQRPTDIIP